ncbi:MAG: haloacid dehalogenase-like hydrolase [Patulibacter sp.]|nr:haloacid dehalogenase-like hydrolase [Patulibacter sp.]
MTIDRDNERWLLLWDIDGTLLLGASIEHARVMFAVLQEVHGTDDPAGGQPIRLRRAAERSGMTDGQIGREILLDNGVDPMQIDARFAEVVRRASEDYDPGDLTAHVNPGVTAVLAELAARDDVVQSLVTGNFERIARTKLRAAAIDGWFDAALGGGFGSDHEQRQFLPEIARQRAGAALRADESAWPRERTIIIGDTPRDIACARHDGVRVVAIATGPHPPENLSEADAVATDAESLRDALLAIVGLPPRPGSPG